VALGRDHRSRAGANRPSLASRRDVPLVEHRAPQTHVAPSPSAQPGWCARVGLEPLHRYIGVLFVEASYLRAHKLFLRL
jgi:hypothetical protein